MRIQRRSKPLILAGDAPTLEFARALLNAFDHLDRQDTPPIVWKTAEAGRAVELADGFHADVFPTVHPVPCHGCILSDGAATLVYGADGAPNPRLAGLDVKQRRPALIHEASGLHQDHAKLNTDGHSSARQAGEAARALGAARLYLCGLRAETAEDIEAVRREAEAAAGVPTVVPVNDQPCEI